MKRDGRDIEGVEQKMKEMSGRAALCENDSRGCQRIVALVIGFDRFSSFF